MYVSNYRIAPAFSAKASVYEIFLLLLRTLLTYGLISAFNNYFLLAFLPRQVRCLSPDSIYTLEKHGFKRSQIPLLPISTPLWYKWSLLGFTLSSYFIVWPSVMSLSMINVLRNIFQRHGNFLILLLPLWFLFPN